MAVYKGCIISKRDLNGKGLLTVCPTGSNADDPNNWISVKYVSFYGGGSYTGAGFVPEVNQEILYDFAENDTTNTYYYLGSVIDQQYDVAQRDAAYPQGKDPSLGREQTMPHDSEDSKEASQSMSYGVTTPTGHHLLMRENRDTQQTRAGVSLKSSQGHGLLLNDVPHHSGPYLYSSGEKATIRLSDSDDDSSDLGPEGIGIKAGGNLNMHSAEGNVSLTVQDGGNMEIKNHSTTSKGTPLTRKSQTGNIIIQSDRGDISLISTGNGIFIDCIGTDKEDGTTAASFQVRSQNKIHLYAEKGIDMKSLGDINIKGRNVNIESDVAQAGTIQLNPLPPNSIDIQMAIRKTNFEIDAEKLFGWWPFFMNPLWSTNYSYFNNVNTSTPLKQL
jgi:hypothetical protein